MSTVFERGLEQWPLERAQAFMEQRRKQARGITTPGSPTNPFFPFDSGSYPYATKLGNVNMKPWTDMAKIADNFELVPVDPFTPSPWRQGGLMLWDATVGIPASVIRPPQIVKTRNVPTNRNVNSFWLNTHVPALGRVGRLLDDGQFMRPKAPFIFDLMMDPRGWEILEGAHALAHRVGDSKPKEHKKTMGHAGSTHFHTQRFLTMMCVCRAYGLPLDVWCLDEGLKGMPDIPQYGIELKSSSYFRTPILRVPALGGETPRPDETLAFIDAGVFIEPHPHGFTTSTGNWKEVNRWSCQPTVVIVAGWELIDVVSHQVLCSTDPDDSGEPVCYGMSPVDLQPPDTFWAYLRYAAQHRGMPAIDNQRYWDVDDWLDSDDYRRALSEAPPLPCMGCTRLNMRSEGAPKRPLSKPPKPMTKREEAAVAKGTRKLSPSQIEWKEWESQLEEVFRIVEKATVYYECRVHGYAKAPRIRAKRIGAHKARLKSLIKIQRLNEAIADARADRRPTREAELRQARDAMMAELNNKVKTDAVNRN